MQFKILIVSSLAAFAAAAPQVGGGNNGDVAVGSTGDVCGQDLELSCCNKGNTDDHSTDVASGLLSGLDIAKDLFKGAGLFDGCSKLDLGVGAVGAGLTDILNQQCKQSVACCQHSGGGAQQGLINAQLPCVAVPLL
ncbi:hypothetical protein G7054_g5912 [Neopestalotiopsis clavispora]|nr:hypothetical protein G7054_g5912 [Neopestalotiopsis clavispora]